jgi:hypothetical protein
MPCDSTAGRLQMSIRPMLGLERDEVRLSNDFFSDGKFNAWSTAGRINGGRDVPDEHCHAHPAVGPGNPSGAENERDASRRWPGASGAAGNARLSFGTGSHRRNLIQQAPPSPSPWLIAATRQGRPDPYGANRRPHSPIGTHFRLLGSSYSWYEGRRGREPAPREDRRCRPTVRTPEPPPSALSRGRYNARAESE